ncbi:MAG: methylmalonyl Co-A mutase-associated GTPase MeaB [Candidatus Cloacimonadaceae bacterium]
MNKSGRKKSFRLPEWTPDQAGKAFASRIVSGKTADKRKKTDLHKSPTAKTPVSYNLDDLMKGVLANDRTILSKAITLLESNAPKHFLPAQELVKKLLPYSGNSVRIGVTGVPGAGKSTFIEALGLLLIRQNHKVAVLAIDPSSSISKGSILGDKTRMENLARMENSFIRPSPASGILGGVARKTRETIIACEAAGYDVILVETVGVGQSEITVRSMVDFFLLLQITGAGDELQDIKKGVIELADLIVINKADGDNLQKAEAAKAEINQILPYLQPLTEGWKTVALTCSALTGYNIQLIWDKINEFVRITKNNGIFPQRRKQQQLEWLDTLLKEELHNLFFSNSVINQNYEAYKQKILAGETTPVLAATDLIELFIEQGFSKHKKV